MTEKTGLIDLFLDEKDIWKGDKLADNESVKISYKQLKELCGRVAREQRQTCSESSIFFDEETRNQVLNAKQPDL
jgi:hypothetical protein